jgi:hypothetical protein
MDLICRTDECFKAASSLSDTVTNPALTTSTSPSDAAFAKHFEINGSLFDYYAGVRIIFHRPSLMIIYPALVRSRTGEAGNSLRPWNDWMG